MVSLLPHKQSFFVSLDTVFSEAGTINCRVPQGSIFGPLFCYMYIIFHKPCQILTHPCMQTTLAFLINIKTLLKLKMIWTFANVCQWFVDNKLSIYFGEDKIKCILFSKEKKCWSVTYDNNRIKQFNIVEYLS